MTVNNTILKKLANLAREDIGFKEHLVIRLQQRCIDMEDIVDNLLNPENLLECEQASTQHDFECKYKLRFRVSNRRNLIIVLLLELLNYII